jgi:protein-tyrosine-phosphatase
MFYPKIRTTIKAFTAEYASIPAGRKEALSQIAAFVQNRVDGGEPVQLIFICTHNSRRSQMAQIWAQTAAAHYQIPGVQTYSGGTEATAFNPRAVAAMNQFGFDILKTTAAENPIYHVQFHEYALAMTAFSKVYSGAPNPMQGFCAVMTCSQADEACPAVFGASTRVALPYEDPKIADNTPQEANQYDERAHQIGREMFYLFSLVKKKTVGTGPCRPIP